jgi:hypothetical protein
MEWLNGRGTAGMGDSLFFSGYKTEGIDRSGMVLEDGASKFYSKMAQMPEDREAQDLFKWLATEEERHKVSLLRF